MGRTDFGTLPRDKPRKGTSTLADAADDVKRRDAVYREGLADAVPNGWKLVPVVPTEKMLASFHGLRSSRISKSLAENIYHRMVSDAPSNEEAARRIEEAMRQ